METEGDCLLKCTNEPAIKTSGTSWDTHYIIWLSPTKLLGYVYSDKVVQSRITDNGEVCTSTELIGFLSLARMLLYLKNKYGEDSPIYTQAYAYFSEGDKK